jgi:hypothetical protein
MAWDEEPPYPPAGYNPQNVLQVEIHNPHSNTLVVGEGLAVAIESALASFRDATFAVLRMELSGGRSGPTPVVSYDDGQTVWLIGFFDDNKAPCLTDTSRYRVVMATVKQIPDFSPDDGDVMEFLRQLRPAILERLRHTEGAYVPIDT